MNQYCNNNWYCFTVYHSLVLNARLCADFFQLPLAIARLVFTLSTPISLSIVFRVKEPMSRSPLASTIILTPIMRRQGEDKIPRLFRQALHKSKMDTVTGDSWRLVLSTTKMALSPRDVEPFAQDIRIFNASGLVDDYNH
jgi:hypothetical protein